MLENECGVFKRPREWQGEKNKGKEIAKSLLDVLDIETISLKTGLSIDEIKRL